MSKIAELTDYENKISANGITIDITEDRYEDNSFDVYVEKLKNKSEKHGHFGSYISEGKYYHFHRIKLDEDHGIWEIPSEGTERFHREGSTGAQFLLYWWKEDGFSFELDS